MSSSEDDTLKVALTLIGVGGFCLYSGLRQNRLIRKIQDIPTSKIDTAHIGDFVEIIGNVYCDDSDITIAPISKKECSCYIWEIQQYIKSKDSGRWSTIERVISEDYLLLKDGGQYLAAVKLADCEMLESTVDKIHGFDSSEISSLPQEIKSSLEKYSKKIDVSKKKGWKIFSNQYRIKERVFSKGLELYILGSTFPSTKNEITKGNFKSLKQEKVLVKETSQEYQKAVKNKSYQRKYDKNGNGKLDNKERQKLYEDLEKGVLSKNKSLGVNHYIKKIKFLFKESKNDKKLFGLSRVQVSTRKESAIIGKMKYVIYMKLAGGILAIPIGIFMLIAFFK